MKEITSLQNPLIKLVKSLHSRKGRKKHQLFIATGLRTVETMLDAGMQPKYLFTTDEGYNLIQDSSATLVPDFVMQKISPEASTAGILAIFDIPKAPQDKISNGVVLAQISDPGNMGTLIRTNAAMGNKTAIIIEGCDPWNPKVVQASAGTIAQTNIYQLSWNELLKQKNNTKLCALVVKKGKAPSELCLKDSLIVVGNEAHGLPSEWANNCEQLLTLPMPGNTESLNAAIAGSIVLYLSSSI